MQRYLLCDKHLSEGGGGYMEEDSDGDWVRYDDSQARAAAAAMEMRERAASVTVDLGPRYDGRPVHYHIPENVKSVILALPIDPDAQQALNQMLVKAREDAIREAAHLIECDGDALGGKSGAAKAILALLNDGDQP